MAGMSSAVRGLIPKSTGGRMALGLGVAEAGAGYGLYQHSKNKGAHLGRVGGGILMGDVALGTALKTAGRMAR